MFADESGGSGFDPMDQDIARKKGVLNVAIQESVSNKVPWRETLHDISSVIVLDFSVRKEWLAVVQDVTGELSRDLAAYKAASPWSDSKLKARFSSAYLNEQKNKQRMLHGLKKLADNPIFKSNKSLLGPK